MLTTRLHPRRN